MKSRILLILLAIMLALSMGLAGCEASCTPVMFSIEAGNVSVMKAGTGNWTEAQAEMCLGRGDVIKCGSNSSGQMTFLDGSIIDLEADTKIVVASLRVSTGSGSTVIDLEQTIGSIIFRVNKMVDPRSRYEVETPTGTVAIRGSAVEIRVVEDGTTLATNLEGDIWAVAQDVELQVPEGQQCIISPGEPPKISSFVQMTVDEIDSLDPAWAYDIASCEQVQYVYETLLFYDREEVDQFVPVLATQWEWNDADLAWRFKIREGVKFQSGNDLTPEDVEYSFERAMVQDRVVGPIWMFYQSLLNLDGSRDWYDNIRVTFDQIDDAVEVDGDWVQFNLADPAWGVAWGPDWGPLFFRILCSPWASIVDKEWCIANGEWDGTAGSWMAHNNPDKADSYLYNHADGTGPWKLEEWDPGVEITLVRNDDYWREPASFETVITRIVDEWSTRREALLAGEADLIQATSPWTPWKYGELEGVQELETIADLNVYKDLPMPWPIAFFFNMNIASDSSYIGSGELDGNGIPTDFLSDIDVRKGFCYAFDYETYIEDGWLGQAQRLGSPVSEGILYFNPDASMYSFDLAKAEEHLRAAWGGEVWEKGFDFTVVCRAGNLQCETACEILTQNLAAINAKFQVSVLPMQQLNFMQMLRSRTMPMFHQGWGPDWPHPDNLVVPFMAATGYFSQYLGYGDSELDELIENALGEADPSVQQDLYYGLQERYYDDAPSIMLCQPLWRRYFTKYIEGFYFNPWINGVPLYYMSKSES